MTLNETAKLSGKFSGGNTKYSACDIEDKTKCKSTSDTCVKKWKRKAREKIRERFSCTRTWWKNFIFSFFPFLTWMPEYRWRRDIISDLVAGITVGIMSIPQGMSYAGIVGVPPVYGLYSNMIPTVLYFFLGTSRLAAIGPPAVLSIMLGNARHKNIPDPRSDISIGCFSPPTFQKSNNTSIFLHLESLKFDQPDCFTSWQLVICMTALTGLILICMGILQLGFLAEYLCEYLVSGFVCGAAVHAITSQLGYLLGMHVPWHSGVGKLIFIYIDLFDNITEASVATVIMSSISVTFLLLIKLVVNPKFHREFGAPFPGELVLVIVGTAFSYFFQLERKFEVATVHGVTAGFPKPTLPRFDLVKRVAVDSVVLAFVLYALSISLAKLYAKRNNYKIDPNQEFFAFGTINIVGSVFQCFVAGQVVSRSLVYESAGAKSQFAGVFGSVLVIITILWIAPLLASLPKCILGSIIFVACLKMLMQLKQLKIVFVKSKADFTILLFTFLFIIFLDVKEGLVASFLYATLIGLLRKQWPRIRRVFYCCDAGDVYVSLENEKDDYSPLEKLFRFEEPLNYITVDRFKRQVYEKCGFSNDDIVDDMRLHSIPISSIDLVLAQNPANDDNANEKMDSPLDFLIIDCSAFEYIDSPGIRVLKQVDYELIKRGFHVMYANCQGDNLETLQAAKFFNEERATRHFPKVEDALQAMQAARDKLALVKDVEAHSSEETSAPPQSIAKSDFHIDSD